LKLNWSFIFSLLDYFDFEFTDLNSASFLSLTLTLFLLAFCFLLCIQLASCFISECLLLLLEIFSLFIMISILYEYLFFYSLYSILHYQLFDYSHNCSISLHWKYSAGYRIVSNGSFIGSIYIPSPAHYLAKTFQFINSPYFVFDLNYSGYYPYFSFQGFLVIEVLQLAIQSLIIAPNFFIAAGPVN
jgi:hypothetical protein